MFCSSKAVPVEALVLVGISALFSPVCESDTGIFKVSKIKGE